MSTLPVDQPAADSPPVAKPYFMPMAFSKEAFKSLSPEQQAIEKKKAGCFASFCCFLIIVIVLVSLLAGGAFAAAASCADPSTCPYSKSSNYDPLTGDAVIYEGTSAVKSIDFQITRGYFVATAGSKNEASVISSTAKADQFQEKNIFTEDGGTWSSVYESNLSSKGVHNCFYCRLANVEMTFDAESLEGLIIDTDYVPIKIVSGDKSKVKVNGDINLEVNIQGGIVVEPELDATGMLKAKTKFGDMTFNETISADTIDISSTGGNFFFRGDSVSATKGINIYSKSNDVLIESSSLTSATGKIEVSGSSVTIKSDQINAISIDIQSSTSSINLDGNIAINANDVKISSGAGGSTIVPKIVAVNNLELLTTTKGPMAVKNLVTGKTVIAVNSIGGPITFEEMVSGLDSVTLEGRGTTNVKKGVFTKKLSIEAGTNGVFDLKELDGTKIDEVSVIGNLSTDIKIDFKCDPSKKIEYSFKYTVNKVNKKGKPVYKTGGTEQTLNFVEDTSKTNEKTGYKFYKVAFDGCTTTSTDVIKVTVDVTSDVGTTGVFEFNEKA